MALSTLPIIREAKVAATNIQYPWDEWRVNSYFIELDEDQHERLEELSDAANLALTIGCGEWVCERLSLLDHDATTRNYLEAAWAAVVHPAYCPYIETIDDEWRGPVRGPLNMTISIVNDGIHCRDTDSEEATRACWMYNLTRHVLQRKDEFEHWFQGCVTRLEQYHPFIESEDIWEEGPPFGLPVPRQAVDLTRPYMPAEIPALLDLYLSGLLPVRNPFLRQPGEILNDLTFRGEPYRYSRNDWEEGG